MTILDGAGTLLGPPHFVDGAWTEPSGPMVRNPLNDSLVAEAAAGGPAERRRRRSRRPRRRFRRGRSWNPGRGSELFLAAAAEIVDRRTRGASSESLALSKRGAAAAFAPSRSVVVGDLLRQAAGWGYLPDGDVLRSDVPGRIATVTRKPLGVVAGFTPWNGAFNLAWRTSCCRWPSATPS